MTKNGLREKVLAMLMTDSRRSYRELARELGVSTTTVSRIVRKFETDGIILGYTTLVDWNRLGYDHTMCLQVSVNPKADIDKLGCALKELPAVKQVFYTTGDSSFSAYAVCTSGEDAAEILEELRRVKGVERVVPHTVLKVF